MDALFHHTAEILKDFDPSEEIASHFRTLMTEGQTMEEHNIFRKEFYLEVIRMAEEKKQKATIEMVCFFSLTTINYNCPSGWYFIKRRPKLCFA